MYNYEEAVTDDVLEFIKENINMEDYAGNESQLVEYLEDILWTEDSVTGNGSGSYFFSTYSAEEALLHNGDLYREVMHEFGDDNLSDFCENPEKADVTIRCYLLNQCIQQALEQLSEEDRRILEYGIEDTSETEESEISESSFMELISSKSS